MAIKYFCDGCDAEIKGSAYSVNKVQISFQNAGETTHEPVNLELCSRCAAKVNPKSWPRSPEKGDMRQ